MPNIIKSNDLYEIINITNQKEWRKDYNLDVIRKKLNKHMQIRIIKKGGKISHQSLKEDYIHYVIKGKYYHYRDSNEGRRNLLSLNEGPEWIGMDRTLNMEYANFTEDSALEECIVIDIEKEYFINCIYENGDISMYLIKNLLKKMSLTSSRTDYMLLSNTKSQILFWLKEYYDYNHKDEEKFVINLKNNYIAENIGISIRTFYRNLNDLKQEGFISSEKGKIVISKAQIIKIKKNIKE